MAIGEELDGVDVGLVAGKGLDGLAGADVPQLGKGVACARDEGVLVGRVEADAHDVAEVVGELDDLGARLDIPLHTCHIARRREDAAVVDEAAAREIAGMARQFAGDAGGAVAVRVEVVDGADVVEAAAGDIVAARGVGAGHDPRGPERDGVHLVGGVGVPDDELAVLRRRHEVSPVRRPVHGVDLCEMALQRPLGPHQLIPLDRVVRLRGDGADCRARGSAWPAGLGEASRDGIEGGTEKNSRVVSASSSFLRLIRSLSVSASRRACWMRACIASGDTSLDRPWSMASTTVVVVGSRQSGMGDGTMRCGSGRGWGRRRGRRAGLRQKSRREWGSQMLLVGVVGEEGELQGGRGGSQPVKQLDRARCL